MNSSAKNRWRFSLKTLLLAMALVAAFFGGRASREANWHAPQAGSWQMILPAGFQRPAILQATGEGQFLLQTGGLLSGTYRWKGRRLAMESPVDARFMGLAWEWSGDDLVLVGEPPGRPAGPSYLGTTLRFLNADVSAVGNRGGQRRGSRGARRNALGQLGPRVRTVQIEDRRDAPEFGSEPFAVQIRVDAGKRLGRLEPVWRFFGADEPNYAYMEHGRKLLGELGALAAQGGQSDREPRSPLPNPPRRGEGTGGDGAQGVYFRAHNLLTSGDGTPALKWGSTGVYREDASGKAAHDWTILDRIFDAYRDAGVRPYVQMGFMPRDLSTKPEPYQHHWNPRLRYEEIFTGWAHPPKDYAKWAELIHAWVTHAIGRYGREEVERWYWETWNEANAGYWQGTREEFFKLHDYSVDAVRRALPTARVGGPDAAGSGGPWTRGFLEHCLRGKNYATGETGTPLDFVAFHAKGAPTQADGHVRMGIAEQLRVIDEGFQIVASFPELKDTPIIIGECDPEGCAACQGPQLGYRNGTMYSSYTAASFARLPELAERRGVKLEGALTWAFEFEGQPLFAGFRSLATGGIDKPVLNVFRMFSMMGGDRVLTVSDHAASLEAVLEEGVRDEPEMGAIASMDGSRVCVLVWHYHDDDVAGADADVEMTVNGLPGQGEKLSVKHYRVDETHSNAFTAWKGMGSPEKPTEEQYAALEKAGRLAAPEVSEARVENGAATIRFALPRKGVALLVVEHP